MTKKTVKKINKTVESDTIEIPTEGADVSPSGQQDMIHENEFLVPFDPLVTMIDAYKAENEKLVFNYEDPKDNKLARSHVADLRKVKTRIADIHRTVKADVLAVCRMIDEKKNILTASVEEMIEVHDAPLRAIKERQILEEKIDLAWDEAYLEYAMRQKEAEIAAVQADQAHRQAELDAREQAIRQQEHDKQVATDAAARAEADVALRLQQAKEAEGRRAIEVEQRHQAELQCQANTLAAEREAERLQQAEDARLEREEQEALAEAEHIRISNQEHRVKIQHDVFQILTGYGMHEMQADELIKALDKEAFPVLRIIY